MKRERDSHGYSYAYEEAEIRNRQYEKDNYSALAAGLASWPVFLNPIEKPQATKEAPVNTPKAELVADGFTLSLQQQGRWE
ncbi:MAG: hypothetical protein PVJ64_03310 [Gemmatimonadales bacterium]|jgi:hypothetical protein